MVKTKLEQRQESWAEHTNRVRITALEKRQDATDRLIANLEKQLSHPGIVGSQADDDPNERVLPWQSRHLRGWGVVAMNHYSCGGRPYLSVTMTKQVFSEERSRSGVVVCIQAQGPDGVGVWASLERRAAEIEEQEGPRLRQSSEEGQAT